MIIYYNLRKYSLARKYKYAIYPIETVTEAN